MSKLRDEKMKSIEKLSLSVWILCCTRRGLELLKKLICLHFFKERSRMKNKKTFR